MVRLHRRGAGAPQGARQAQSAHNRRGQGHRGHRAHGGPRPPARTLPRTSGRRPGRWASARSASPASTGATSSSSRGTGVKFPPRHLPRLGAGLRAYPDCAQHRGRGPSPRRVQDHGRRRPGSGRLHPQPGIPRPGAQSQRQQRRVHTHVRGGGTGAARSKRAAPVAPLRVPGQDHAHQHRRAGDLRRARRLRHPLLLHHLPGVCEPVSRQGPDAGQGLVEGRGEAQAHLPALPAGNGPVRGVRRLHEGLPGPALRA